MNNSNLFKALVLSTLSIAGTASLAADTAAEPAQVTVKYGDLDLQSEAGLRLLEKRVTRAAHSVCPNVRSREIQRKAAGKACVDQAVRQALGQVEQWQLANAARAGRNRS